jgi:hypothetical protein
MNLSKKQNLFFLFVLCLCLFSGCSEDEGEPSPTDTGNITFTVGDKSFSLTNIEAVIREGWLDVSAFNGKDEILSITHRSGLAAGEYDLTSQGSLFLSVIYFPRDGGSNYGPFAETPAGKLVITSINEEEQTMTGTFEGVLVRYEDHEDEIAINGSFTFPYTIEGNKSKDPYFLHKINGQNFEGGISSHGYYGERFFFKAYNGTEGIELQVKDDAVGTYTAGSIGNGETNARYWIGLNSYGSTSGTVTITSNQIGTTGLISGTYSFQLESYPGAGNKITITEGTFTVQRH